MFGIQKVSVSLTKNSAESVRITLSRLFAIEPFFGSHFNGKNAKDA